MAKAGRREGKKKKKAKPKLSAVVRTAPTIKTFRDLLVAAVSELLKQEAMSCPHTEDGLINLIVALARYREEGVALYPKFVICDDLDATLKRVQGAEAVELGKGDRAAATISDALKKCAP